MKKEVFLGIDIGGTNIKLAVVGRSGKVFSRGLVPTLPRRGLEEAFKRIKASLPFLLQGDNELAGAGVGCAGLVDIKRGVLLSSPNLQQWENEPLARAARRALGVRTIIDNDATAAAFGEYRCGSGRGRAYFICITLGTGVGGGIVLNGKLLRGAANFAGELGHMTIDRDGPRCTCGNKGCLEAFIGAKAMVKLARLKMKTKRGRILGRVIEAGSRALTPRIITRAALSGDRVAREVLDETAKNLGCAIASLINIFNPEVVAIAGGVSGAFDIMKKAIQEEVRSRAFEAPARLAKITRAQLGNDASTVGAALMARDYLR